MRLAVVNSVASALASVLVSFSVVASVAANALPGFVFRVFWFADWLGENMRLGLRHGFGSGLFEEVFISFVLVDLDESVLFAEIQNFG